MPSNSYLITGIAGTGKSTLKNEFQNRGHTSYDLDDGFTRWIDRSTGEVATYGASSPMTLKHDWLVDAERIAEIQNAVSEDTYFFGSAHNLFEHTALFKIVFLLSYPNTEILQERILGRTGNDYGKRPGEIEDIISYWKPYDMKFIAHDASIIDCALPIDEITHIIEQSTTRHG